MLSKSLTPESNADTLRIFALDVHLGLSAVEKSLPSKYFYDEIGSMLFQKIMKLPEYYLTDAEAEILNSHKSQLAALFGSEPFALVELGAGDAAKTKILIEHFLMRNLDFHYAPIDISESALNDLETSLTAEFPNLTVQIITAEFVSKINGMQSFFEMKTLLLFLGSSIGNFTIPEMILFLKTLWHSLNPGDYAFIGFDLKKDIPLMQAAYDDSSDVTKAFNLNLLTRINRELGGNFDVDKFYHHCIYNPRENAMESYLVSTAKQDVFITALNSTYRFEPFEAIFTERSHKFSETDILDLAESTGFELVQTFIDSKRLFANSLWRVKK